jgi:hypothetical protein
MKRKPALILSTLILATLLFSGQLKAQRFKGAVMGGMTLTQVDGDEVYGYHRVGGHLGAAAILPINNFDITLELNFTQKGAYQKPQYNADTATGEYDLRLNYLEIPLLVHYTDKEFIGAGLGFSYGRLVGFQEIEHGGLQPPYSDEVPFNNDDFNVLVEAQIRIWQRLKFNIRFSYSMAKIRTRTYSFPGRDDWTRKQYNNVLTFRLVYVFNERIARQTPE